MKLHIGRRMIVALIGILLIAGLPVWAQGVVNPIGQPNVVVRGQPAYYIWADQGGWHVRWTTPYPAVFTGTLTSDGEVQNLHRAAGGTPGWLSRFGANRIIFGTATFGNEGFDFTTTGSSVTFNLLVNAFHVSPSQVFLGRASANPPGMPFVAVASPALLAQGSGTEERAHGVDIREIRDRQREIGP